MVAVGDKFPNVTLQKGPFPPQKVDMTERLAGKKTIRSAFPAPSPPPDPRARSRVSLRGKMLSRLPGSTR